MITISCQHDATVPTHGRYRPRQLPSHDRRRTRRNVSYKVYNTLLTLFSCPETAPPWYLYSFYGTTTYNDLPDTAESASVR